jgi:hypothetical protein
MMNGRVVKGVPMGVRVRVAGWVALLAGLAGCGSQTELGGQQRRVIESADADRVLSAAANILRREFGQVHMDRESRAITCGPVEFTTTSESGSARDLVRGRSTMRRQAHFSVGRRGDETVAQLRIDIERKDTAKAAAAPTPGTRLSDSPGYTPIERDAATTQRQNEVWSFVRRDERLERLLLSELQDQFATPTTGAPGELPAESQAGGSP